MSDGNEFQRNSSRDIKQKGGHTTLKATEMGLAEKGIWAKI
jgi:hypothetical protein